MGKAPYAILGVVALVVIGFTVYAYSVTGNAAVFGMLLVLAPFVLFGIGMHYMMQRNR
jgi:hypothetical protein